MPAHERIRQRLEELNLSKSKLARVVSRYLPSIDSSDVSKIVAGKRKVRADEVRYFAWALKCRTKDLMEPDLDDPPPEY